MNICFSLHFIILEKISSTSGICFQANLSASRDEKARINFVENWNERNLFPTRLVIAVVVANFFTSRRHSCTFGLYFPHLYRVPCSRMSVYFVPTNTLFIQGDTRCWNFIVYCTRKKIHAMGRGGRGTFSPVYNYTFYVQFGRLKICIRSVDRYNHKFVSYSTVVVWYRTPPILLSPLTQPTKCWKTYANWFLPQVFGAGELRTVRSRKTKPTLVDPPLPLLFGCTSIFIPIMRTLGLLLSNNETGCKKTKRGWGRVGNGKEAMLKKQRYGVSSKTIHNICITRIHTYTYLYCPLLMYLCTLLTWYLFTRLPISM